MMGYIMKKRHKAIGMEMTGASFMKMAIPSSVRAKSGAIFPSAIPETMHRATHTVR
jgi:hypothetical protein